MWLKPVRTTFFLLVIAHKATMITCLQICLNIIYFKVVQAVNMLLVYNFLYRGQLL
jgi:hypothetical protein